MRPAALILASAILLVPQLSGAIEVSGDQWGVWSPDNNPYEVVGEVRVPPGSTLVIEPGVVVSFKGYYRFLVDSSAALYALGTETDSIYFTTADTLTGWHGIRFNSANQNSELRYCCIEYGKAQGSSPEDHGGGVLCRRSSITISNNTFRGNSASGSGGGLCLIFSSLAAVRDNLFINNSAQWGGGMRCKSGSSAELSGNTFIGNRGTAGGGGLGCTEADAVVTSNLFRDNHGSSGGAINIRYCSATIQDNLLENNQADQGGGLKTFYSDAALVGNTIRNNSAEAGGGIYCERSGPEIRDNIVSNNNALQGGGVCSRNSTPLIENNTIAFNSATESGGGLYWQSPVASAVTNTILWGNKAPEGGQIYVQGRNPEITYCDVQGGCPGRGNINSDPLFVSSTLNDFSLRWRSPCIDRGDPQSSPDPDLTRADIGAHYFDHRIQVFTEIWPYGDPVIIPPEGGNVFYDYWAYNFTNGARSGDLWIYLVRPDQGQTLLQYLEDITIPPQDSIGEDGVRQRVYRSAPEGFYTVITCLGRYPHNVNDSSYFVFYKGMVTDVEDGLQGGEPLPGSFSLRQNHPNPFNATTVIRYQLPSATYVKLQVYDLLGRRVATLFEGKQEGGYTSVVWDARDDSSGLYFYKLTANVGDRELFSDVKKMLLVK